MKHFYLAGVGTDAGQINQVTDQDFDPGVQEMVDAFDGQVDATFAAAMLVQPQMNFSTTALALALGYIPLGGLGYTSSDDPVNFYWQPAQPNGTRNTTDCVLGSSAQGMLCVGSVSADDGSPATVSIIANPISTNGTTNPLTITTGVTLPTPVMTRQVFTVGPVKINGVLIGGVKSTRVDFGLQITRDQDGGVAYPTLAYIGGRRARATVRTTDVSLIESLGFFSPHSTSNKSTFYFRKMLQGSTRVPDATAQHVSLASSNGMIIARRIAGGNGHPAMAELEIPITWDGTNATVAVNTATAIA